VNDSFSRLFIADFDSRNAAALSACFFTKMDLTSNPIPLSLFSTLVAGRLSAILIVANTPDVVL